MLVIRQRADAIALFGTDRDFAIGPRNCDIYNKRATKVSASGSGQPWTGKCAGSLTRAGHFCRTITMLSLTPGAVKHPLKALTLALGVSVFSSSFAIAEDHGSLVHHEGRFKHYKLGYGTLGWAEYGLNPGLYGFSLRWHPGYGYGRFALGVGADGGYPFYGGPGYPHEPPHLRRFGPTEPYAFYGGTGDPNSACTNFYQGIGGLVVAKPVVSIGEPGELGFVGKNGERNPGADFGQYTGALPYPETYFTPNAAAGEATGSSGAERQRAATWRGSSRSQRRITGSR
jgi:hypothetical protein